MEPTRCEWCGADPAVGYAFLYDSAGSRRYCHPDRGVSCYEAAQLAYRAARRHLRVEDVI